MVDTSASRPQHWRTVLIGLLTAGLFALFLRNVDLREAWAATARSRPGWILAAVGASLLTYLARSRRWQVLLAPVSAVSFRTSFRATVIGFAANLLLPARAGEFLRAYVVARHEPVSAASVFATVVVERMIDLVTVLLLFACAILFSGIDVGAAIEAAGWAAAGAAAVGLAVLFLAAGHPERVGTVVDRLTERLPARIGGLVSRLARTLTAGLAVMRSPWHFALAMLWSLPVWLAIAAGIAFTSWAFELPISFVGSFLVVGYLTVGVTVPTPGAAGGFHYFYQLALTQFFDAPESAAAAAAIVLHLVSFVPVTLLGLVFMGQDGLTLGQARRVGADRPAASSTPS